MMLIKAERMILFKRVLSALHEGFPDAFIAGGAVRDAIHDKPHNDIDVFTWEPIPLDELMPADDNPFEDNPGSEGSPWVEAVANPRELDDGTFVQLVQLKRSAGERPPTIASVVSSFHLGICQCWFDGERVHWTPHFTVDRALRQMTVITCMDTHEMVRALRKAASIHSKYPWPLVVPQHLVHYLGGVCE